MSHFNASVIAEEQRHNQTRVHEPQPLRKSSEAKWAEAGNRSDQPYPFPLGQTGSNTALAKLIYIIYVEKKKNGKKNNKTFYTSLWQKLTNIIYSSLAKLIHIIFYKTVTNYRKPSDFALASKLMRESNTKCLLFVLVLAVLNMSARHLRILSPVQVRFGAVTSTGPVIVDQYRNRVYLSDLLKIHTPSWQLRSSADSRMNTWLSLACTFIALNLKQRVEGRREGKKSLDKRHRISAVFLRPLIFPKLGRRVVSLTLRLVGDLLNPDPTPTPAVPHPTLFSPTLTNTSTHLLNAKFQSLSFCNTTQCKYEKQLFCSRVFKRVLRRSPGWLFDCWIARQTQLLNEDMARSRRDRLSLKKCMAVNRVSSTESWKLGNMTEKKRRRRMTRSWEHT